MKIRIYRQWHFGPFVRLNLYTGGLSISFGHARIGWLTVGRKGVSETLDTGVSGVYLRDSQTWDRVLKALRLRK
jgi:hypothetical protein